MAGNWFFHWCKDFDGDRDICGGDLDTRWYNEKVFGTGVNDTVGYIWDNADSAMKNKFDAAQPIWNNDNHDFQNWISGWNNHATEQALWDGIFRWAIDPPAGFGAAPFPKAKWGNYDVVDASWWQFPYLENKWWWKWNTQPGKSIIDFSSPRLYDFQSFWNNFTDPDLGSPYADWDERRMFYEIIRIRSQACRSGGPNKAQYAPWVPYVGMWLNRKRNEDNEVDYFVTPEDLRYVLHTCWRAGANEFLIFLDDAARSRFPETIREIERFIRQVRLLAMPAEPA